MKKTFLNLAFISAFCFGMNAQVKIGNNPERIDVNAILELESKVGGVLLPRLSLRNSISSFPLSYHVKGMMVYNLTDTADVQEGIYVNNGSKWIYSGSNSKFGSVGGDLRSDDNIIQVANGAGALLKDVKIKINDTILAGRMTAKPYSDSMISAVARNADKSPLKESFIKVISDNVSSQPLIGSIARATDASPLRDSLLNLVADNASNAPIVGALARATDAAPLRDSLLNLVADNASNAPIVGALARATDAAPLRDSLLNLVADNASNAPIVGALARATDATPFKDSLINLIAHNVNNKPLRDSLFGSKAFKDSVNKLVTGASVDMNVVADEVVKKTIFRDSVISIMSNNVANQPFIGNLAKATDVAPFRDSIINLISDNASNQPLVGSLARATDAAPFRDSIINLIADNNSNQPLVGSLARATDVSPFKDSLINLIADNAGNSPLRDKLISGIQSGASDMTSTDAAIKLNAGSVVPKSVLAAISIDLDDAVLSSRMESQPYVGAIAKATDVSPFKDSLVSLITATVGSGGGSGSDFYSTNGTLTSDRTVTLGSNKLNFSPTMTIDGATNRVGIGTSSPTEKLDVDGNVKFSGALMPNGNPGTTGQVLVSQGPGQPPIWTSAHNVPMNVRTEVGNYTATLNDDIIIFDGPSSSFQIELPTAGIPIGKRLYIVNTTTSFDWNIKNSANPPATNPLMLTSFVNIEPQKCAQYLFVGGGKWVRVSY